MSGLIEKLAHFARDESRPDAAAWANGTVYAGWYNIVRQTRSFQ
jgi:hypothetical protein